ncbi:probable G-protein coupled receptor 160 [Archocentrus centrarchus]|uniref:probable G-protein coupled receptor 160 n=1 Tax=Archocentrus centrarchus TaxID=63155 RepID=UPI0011E9C0A9|nr:probable G-protein coupled receptor 160 [Archocentrus centrarchus]
MLPELPSLSETSHTVKMLAIIQQWEGVSGSYTDNTVKYVFLLFSKAGLEMVIFYLLSQKRYTFFMNVCSLSIILADLVLASLMATVWFLGADQSFTPCFLLANASAAYGKLPLPMMCLGLLDYSLGNICLSKHRAFWKTLWNVFLTFLTWLLAVWFSFGSPDTKLMNWSCGKRIKALVCEVEESTLMSYFIAGLFTAVLLIMLPFWSQIPQWVKEAERLCEAREEQESMRSDLLFTFTSCTETKSDEENYLEDVIQHRPPLWISLTLGFATFWMPFLAVSFGGLLLGFGLPAYISVNLLWLECTNSLLVGVLFWIKSRTLGPYTHLPENVCLWSVYWHLSKGTQQKQLPVLSPLKEKINIFYYV